MTQALSKFESATRLSLENTVKDHAEKSLHHGEIAGAALIELREKKLYRSTHSTFEKYVEEAFPFKSNYARRLITLHEMKSGPNGHEIKNERQAREIARVPEERRANVMEVAKSNGPVSAQSIRQAAQKVIDVEAVVERKDEIGYVIPEPVLALFDRVSEVKTALDSISSVRSALKAINGQSDELWKAAPVSKILMILDQVYADLKLAIPYAVCPYCQGLTKSECTACKKRGALSRYHWDTIVPEELKNIRLKSIKEAA